MKKCSMCKEDKPIEDFGNDKSRKDCLNHRCKECNRKHRMDYYNDNPEYKKHNSAESKRWRKEHPERTKELSQKWRDNNIELVREVCRKSTKKWYKNNREYVLNYQSEYRENNSEKVVARRKVRDALRKGEMKKPNKCSMCMVSGTVSEGHHYDYSEPLNVTWLCSPCHTKLHNEENKNVYTS